MLIDFVDKVLTEENSSRLDCRRMFGVLYILYAGTGFINLDKNLGESDWLTHTHDWAGLYGGLLWSPSLVHGSHFSGNQEITEG